MDGIKKKVLVIDDDPAIQKIIRLQLQVEGYEVLCAGDIPAAMEAVKTDGIVAALLDLHLADGDGFQVLEKIKKVKPALPVIMVTGSHDEDEARKAMEMGAWDYVTKPIDFQYLKNILLMQSSK